MDIDLVAIYAAIVATVALGWRIYEWLKRRPNIKVKVMFLYKIDTPGIDPKKEFISATAMNCSLYPTTINVAGLRTSKKGFSDLQHVDAVNSGYLPRRLNQGESLHVVYDPDEIKKALQNNSGGFYNVKYAFFRDQADREYNGRIPKEIKKILN